MLEYAICDKSAASKLKFNSTDGAQYSPFNTTTFVRISSISGIDATRPFLSNVINLIDFTSDMLVWQRMIGREWRGEYYYVIDTPQPRIEATSLCI